MTHQEFIQWLDKEIGMAISSDSGARAFAFVEAKERALIISPPIYNSKIMIQKWEYCKWEFSSVYGALEGNLNALGEAGWELVGIHVVSETIAKYIFKRPKNS